MKIRISFRRFERVTARFHIEDFIKKICCFSAKHAVLESKINNLLTRNQDIFSEW
jgi:hypothetical protein